jgi:transposase
MVKALSLDLRVRALKAVSEGASHRAVAERFGVSAASVSRWRALARRQGEPRPGPLGGDRRSARIEAQGGLIRELLETTPDITTEELRAALVERKRSATPMVVGLLVICDGAPLRS